jgi:peptidoglycan/LPS O-acetylase OafA/YrhL
MTSLDRADIIGEEMKTQKTRRISFLDSIRGLAALAVFLEHAGDTVWPQFRDFTHNSFSLGKFGVTAFFLTSGFVIPFSMERGKSVRNFWISRFFRLYPLYWLSIALVTGLYLLGINAVDQGYTLHLARNAIVNLTMFEDFVRVPEAEGLYYTLAMEMVFYIFFSVLFVRNLNHYSMRIAWLACAGLAAVGVAAPVLLQRRVPLAGLFYFLCLFVGTAVYRHFMGEVGGRALTVLFGCLLLCGIAEIYCNYVLVKKADLTELFTFWAVFLPWSCAYILFLAAYLLRAYQFPRILTWLGTISYSVYLLHPPMVALAMRWSNRSYSFALMLTLTLFCASLTYRFLEKPFIDLGKRLQTDSSRLPGLATESGPTTVRARLEPGM